MRIVRLVDPTRPDIATDRPMVAADTSRNARRMRREDRQALRQIRTAIDATGEPLRMADRELRAAVVAVSCGRSDALALTVRLLNAAPRKDDAGGRVDSGTRRRLPPPTVAGADVEDPKATPRWPVRVLPGLLLRCETTTRRQENPA